MVQRRREGGFSQSKSVKQNSKTHENNQQTKMEGKMQTTKQFEKVKEHLICSKKERKEGKNNIH